MFTAMLEMALGPWGRALLAFYFEHRVIILLLFLPWGLLMTAATYQLRLVRDQTIRLGLAALQGQTETDDARVWEALRPEWEAMLARTARFVPTRLNVWVQRATPAAVMALLRLGPEWVTALRAGEVRRDALAMPGPNTPLKSFQTK